MQITPAQILRVEKDMQSYAGDEPITVELKGSTFYVYGSELACLRLFRKYWKTKNVRTDYSINLKTWYFTLETGLNLEY